MHPLKVRVQVSRQGIIMATSDFPTLLIHLAPRDYTSQDVNLAFGPGSLEICVSVPISDDPVHEQVIEIFGVELTTLDSAVDLALREATVAIVSDDSKYLQQLMPE